MAMKAILLSGEDIGLSKKAARDAVRETHNDIGHFWHKRFLRLHFMAAALFRYGYKQRTRKTQRRKRQLAERGEVEEGGLVPLVWSGRMKREIMGMPVVQATPAKVVVRMIAPNYVMARGRRMYKEITAVTDSEVQQISQYAQDRHDKITARLSRPVKRRST